MKIKLTNHAKIRIRERAGTSEYDNFIKDELSICRRNRYKNTLRIISKSDFYFILEIENKNEFKLMTVLDHPHYNTDDRIFGETKYDDVEII